jgi:glycosyltransferase involved in cell wall biosynthesis
LVALIVMMDRADRMPLEHDQAFPEGAGTPIIIATIFPEDGTTGVHTHFRQLRRFIEPRGIKVSVDTPFSWGRLLTYPVFAPRLLLKYVHPSASVLWYRHWHELFLYRALRRDLAKIDNCVVYAQGPLEAKAALRARTGPQQRVVMAVHFRTSQADEHAEPGRELRRDDAFFRAIRKMERDVILRLDGIVYVARWAQDALMSWLPEAASVPSIIVANFVDPMPAKEGQSLIADIVTTGRLDDRKNHRFLLEVLAEAKKTGHRLTLDIFGEGPRRRDLERWITELGLDGQVNLRGYRRDVRNFLPRYRVYAHAAYGEVSPLAVIEALAAGLPVLAPGIGPIAEICDDGVEGRFWPLDNPVKATSILLEILGSEPVRLKAATAAKERFHRDYDASVLGPRLASFLLGISPTSAAC